LSKKLLIGEQPGQDNIPGDGARRYAKNGRTKSLII
jgi:hypothetical protein